MTLLLHEMGRSANVALILLSFTSELALAWALIGAALFLLGLLEILRTRAAQQRWVRQYQALSIYMTEGVILCNAKGRIVWHNEAAHSLQAAGWLHPTLQGLLKRTGSNQGITLQTLSVGEGSRYAVQGLALDGRTFALIARPLQSTAQSASFYESFIRRIVHDMRNPLAAIIGHAANLRQSSKVEPEQWRKSATTIEDEAQRLARLVDSMLFDARLAYVPLDIQQHNLVDILEEALYAQDERAQQAGKTLEMDTSSGPMLFEADRDLLVRAFENLIDNSLKYSNSDGHLRICSEILPNAYLIHFEDNGEGIPPEYLPDQIFEPLVRARAHGAGSGLGLSIVRKIIEMHGGTISAKSRVGEGTIMTIRLPRTGAVG